MPKDECDLTIVQSPQVHFIWRDFEALSVVELHEVMSLRQRVFIVEQRCFYLDADKIDHEALHLLGFIETDHGATLVAYLRVYPDHEDAATDHPLSAGGLSKTLGARVKIGRVVIARNWRDQGLGLKMMQICHDELRERGVTRARLASQAYIEGFYFRLGYTTIGEEFMDAGIPHVMMTKTLEEQVNTQKIKHLIFDFDGTLVDSADDYARCFQTLAAQRTPTRPLPEVSRIRELMFAGVRPQLEYTLGPLSDAEYQEALTHFRKICHEVDLSHTALYPGVESALSELKSQGYTFSICTNRPQDFAEETLDFLKIREHFSVIVGGDRGLERKPDPAMLTYLWEETGYTPLESVMIGDSEVDVLAAHAGGCPAIAVTWGYTPYASLASVNADALIDQVSELSAALKRIEKQKS